MPLAGIIWHPDLIEWRMSMAQPDPNDPNAGAQQPDPNAGAQQPDPNAGAQQPDPNAGQQNADPPPDPHPLDVITESRAALDAAVDKIRGADAAVETASSRVESLEGDLQNARTAVSTAQSDGLAHRQEFHEAIDTQITALTNLKTLYPLS